jgi:hypothetical protein
MTIPARDRRPRAVTADELVRRNRDAFSTALFTGLNVAVFLVLAASVIGAAVLYSQGA